MIEIDEARGLLARAILTKGPSFIYCISGNGTACQYTPRTDVEDDDPRAKTGCLIGVALDIAGFTLHHHQDFVKKGIVALWEDPRWAGAFSEQTARYFSRAQNAQDQGDSWGVAYSYAEKYVTAGCWHTVLHSQSS